MNTIYRIVWNATIGKWVVASELAKAHGKRGSSKKMVSLVATGTAFLGLAGTGAAGLMYAPMAMASYGDVICVAYNGTASTFGQGGTAGNCVASMNGSTFAGPTDPHGGTKNYIGLTAAGTSITLNNDTQTIYFRPSENAHTATMVDTASGVLLSGLANGVVSPTSTDAINGSVLYQAGLGGFYHSVNDGGTPMANQLNDGATALYSQADGIAASATGTAAVAAGYQSTAAGASAIAIGSGANATADNSVAIGSNSIANRANTVSVGAAGSERQITNVAAGTAGTDAVNVNQLGGVQSTLQTQITNLGNSTGLVQKDATSGNITVGKDANGTTVDMTGTQGARTVTGVASGAVSATSTDAVNGARLFGTSQSVASAIGGGSTVNADGTVSAPTYSLNGGTTTVHSMGDAISNVDVRTTQNTNDIAAVQSDMSTVQDDITNIGGRVSTVEGSVTNITNQLNDGTVGLVQQDPTTGNITVAANTDGTAVDMTGTQGARIVTGVATGAVNASSVDAVNGSQLYGVSKSLASALGGGSSVSADGSLTGTSFNVNGDKYSTLQDAITAAAQSGDANNPYVAGFGNPTGSSPAASATAFGSAAIGLGSVANSTNTISVGNASTGLMRRITNVADATGAHDAATWGQVQGYVGGETSNTVAQFDAKIADVNNAVTTQATQLSALMSAAPATASADPYVQVDNDGGYAATVPAGSYGVAIGEGAVVGQTGYNGIAIGLAATSNSSYAIAIGSSANASGNQAVALGTNSLASNSNTVAVGNGVVATGNAATAMGFSTQASGGNAIAIGNSAQGNIADAIALGTSASVATQNSVAIGRLSKVTTDAVSSVALGAGSVANRANSVSVGKVGAERQITNVAAGTADTDAVNVSQLKTSGLIDSSGNAVASVTYDQNADGTPNYGSVTLGGVSATAPVELHNVANGMVSVTSTDAINGSQMYNTSNSVAGALGGGSAVNADGTVTAPTYALNGGMSTAHSVGDALSNIDGRVTQNSLDITAAQGDIANITNQLNAGGVGLVNQDPTTGNITVAKNTGGSAVDMTGTDGAHTITGIKDGSLAADSTDAVTGSQLNTTNTNVADLGTTVAGIDGRVSTVEGSVTNITNQLNAGTVGLVQQDPTTRNITVAANTDGSTVDMTGTQGARTVKGVAAGAVNASSVDAVNGGQLFGTSQSVASAIGGGSSVNADGTVSAPTYSLNGDATTAHSVGDAIGNIDGRTTQNTNDIAGVQSDVSSVQGDLSGLQGQMADAVAYDDSTHGSVTLGGTSATAPVALHNVAAGTLSATSNDAVNGSQLFATNQQVGQNASNISNVQGDVNDIQGAITNINNSLSNLGDGTVGLVQQDANTSTITVGKDAKGTTVDMTGTQGARTVTGVNAGAVNASSVDAVNGSQLFGTSQSVANAIGGGSSVNADGTISAPKYSLNGGTTTASNIGDAIGNIDGRTTQNANDIADVQSGVSAVQGDLSSLQGQMTDAVAYDDSAHASVTLGGTSATSPVALHNVAAGAVSATSNDAVNGSQLFGTSQSVANAIGGGSSVNADGTVSAPAYSLNGGKTTANNIGDAIGNIDGRTTQNANDIADVQSGVSSVQDDLSNLQGQMTDAVAYDDSTHGSVTLGGTSATSPVALHNVAAGAVSAASNDAVNGSQLFGTSESVANAIGGGSTVNADGTISAPKYSLNGGKTTAGSIGDAIANVDGRTTQNTTDIAGVQSDVSSVQGDLSNLQGKMTDAVAYDDSTHGSVTMGGTSATAPVALHNVAAGAVSAASNDAVNGSQLFGTSQSVASAIGGGSTVNADGTVSAPTYSLNGGKTTAGSIGDAIGNIDGRTTQNTNDIAGVQSDMSTVQGDITNIGGRVSTVEGSVTNITNQLNDGTVGLVQQDPATRNITVAANTDGAAVDMTGTQGARTVTGVAAGAVNASSVDAVNGSQLFGTSQSVANAIGGGSTVNADGTITGPTYSLNGGTTTVHSMGDAITNIDGRTTQNTTDITHVQGDITNITSQLNTSGVGLVQQDPATSNIKVAAATGGSTVDVTGTDGDRTITGVAAGQNDDDAVNVQQLKDTGLLDDNGNALNAVVYDNASMNSITLGGLNAMAPVILNNVAAGEISPTSTQAVNGAELYSLTQVVNSNTAAIGSVGDRVTSLENNAQGSGGTGGSGAAQNAVIYDTSAQDKVTLGNQGTSVAMTNVADGQVAAGSTDAVTGNQLFQTNAQVGELAQAVSNLDANGNSGVSTGPSDGAAAAATGDNSTALGGGSIASGDGSTATGNGSAASGDNSTATGSGSTASGTGSTATGSGSVASGDNSTATGDSSTASGDGSTATGNGSIASGDNSTANGSNSTASGSGSTAIGSGSAAAGDNGTALGNNSNASGQGSTSIGSGSTASGSGSTALGNGSSATGSNSMALGGNASAPANNAVALGNNSVADRDNTVSVGSAGNERQITNVAAGTQATDAANVGQVQDAVGNVQNWANQKFTQVNRNIDRIGAMSAAYGQMAFSAQGLDTPNKVGVGIGTQNGQAAIAVGYSRQITPHVNLSFGGSASSNQVSVGAGVSAGW